MTTSSRRMTPPGPCGLRGATSRTSEDPTQVLEAPGLACVSLTPLIKRTISQLDPGDILEVRSDDPAAREGIPAWCRLTQNPLLEAVEHDPCATTFRIRKNNRNHNQLNKENTPS